MATSAKPAWITAVLAAGLLVTVGAGAASASLKVYENSEEAAQIAEVRSAKCKVRRFSDGGRSFAAVARSTDRAWNLTIDIRDFRGNGREYNVRYGGSDLAVDFEQRNGPADFSNSYPFPGTPPGSAGAVALSPGGKRVGVGIYALPNSDYTQGVAIAGAMRCRYR